MLNKEQFLNAMTFFDEFDAIRDELTEIGNKFFDGNGVLYIGHDKLYDRYLDLLKEAMDIPTNEEYDPISYWLFEADERIFDKPDKNDKCYYDTNVYTEMAEKYNIEKVLADMLDSIKNDGVDFITIQGETYGSGVQKRDYSMNNERDFMAFNLIFGSNDGFTERANPKLMTTILNGYGIPCVPIVDEDFEMPETCDEILLNGVKPDANFKSTPLVILTTQKLAAFLV